MAKNTTEEKSATLDPAPEAVAAEKELAANQAAEAPKGISEEEITAKVRAGLTRAQAIEVITAQRAHDKGLKKG